MYYANYQIVLDGDFETEILALLEADGYNIPATAMQWGYECVDATGEVEIDVLYDEEYEFTFVTVYATADLY